MSLELLAPDETAQMGERRSLPDRYLGLPDAEMATRIAAAKRALGERLLILGHHYQRDEVIAFADHTGDSFKLARRAAEQRNAEYIVFCGVHFMAESADVLSGPGQQVILVYGPRSDIGPVPEDGEPLLTLFQFGAEGVFQKQIFPDTLIEELEVAGLPMLWFEGAAHILKYQDPDGSERVELERIVNRNTLAWELDDVTYRIETILPRETVVGIAVAVVEAANESSSITPGPRADEVQPQDRDALTLANLTGKT